ncbi:MAG: TIGR03936 family radical SAM-associated protein [Candidatus Omnitrophota bacterium]
MKFYFSKKGLMRFISHLDLMRLFARAARRAGLPLFISQGFSPHPKIRLKRAIKLGEEREREEGEIVLSEQIGKEEFCQRLNRHLPEGVTVSE